MPMPINVEQAHRIVYAELQRRLRARTTEEKITTPVTPVIHTKAKEPKPMTQRTTKNHTGLEDYTNEQLRAKFESSSTGQEVYRCHLEFQNRLSKYRETVPSIVFKGICILEEEYQKYHNNNNNNGFTYNEPEPEPEPPPPPPVSLTWEIIKAIEEDACEYGPYLYEILASDWDYKDRRPHNVPMKADQGTAKDWTYSHRDDDGTIDNLSDAQKGLLMVLLKAYFFHKRRPEYQYNAPPF